ncbi:hypothetical protein AVEN_215233-1 [Araneus ventricosus]|uniref:Uncharacterized protein n=1 Tax=Araneus ventricosus TaxID=182803 RepID=A0A4Y2UAA9_ARAVE|nr:hypothetical protein AVEN_215233-1 [Araneus ventricosus]
MECDLPSWVFCDSKNGTQNEERALFDPVLAETISAGKCPSGGPFAFYRVFVNLVATSGSYLVEIIESFATVKEDQESLAESLRATTVWKEDQESPAGRSNTFLHEIHCSEGGHPSRLCEKISGTLKCVVEVKPRRFCASRGN